MAPHARALAMFCALPRTCDRRLLLVLASWFAIPCSGAQESWIMTKDGKRRDYPLSAEGSTGGASIQIGEPEEPSLELKNTGKETIRFPLSALRITVGNVKMLLPEKAVAQLEGGANETVNKILDMGIDAAKLPARCFTNCAPVVKIPHPNGDPNQGPLYEPVVVLEPGQSIRLWTEFMPWEPGAYQYEVTLENKRTDRNVMLDDLKGRGTVPVRPSIPGTPPELVWNRPVLEPIENCWVGRISETLLQLVLDAHHNVNGVWDEQDEWPGFPNLRGAMNAVKATVRDKGKKLSERLTAISHLVDLRHLYATKTLEELEAETQDEPLIHYHVVKALYDLFWYGTGHAALPTICKMTQKRSTPSNERTLCLEILRSVVDESKLMHNGLLVHEFTKEEKDRARVALASLRRGDL